MKRKNVVKEKFKRMFFNVINFCKLEWKNFWYSLWIYYAIILLYKSLLFFYSSQLSQIKTFLLEYSMELKTEMIIITILLSPIIIRNLRRYLNSFKSRKPNYKCSLTFVDYALIITMFLLLTRFGKSIFDTIYNFVKANGFCLYIMIYLSVVYLLARLKMRSNFENEKHIFDEMSDHPIVASENDILGRGSFVDLIYQQLIGIKGDDSYVFGLYGDWGEGKTSIIKMIVEKIEKDEKKQEKSDSKLLSFVFEPWHFGNAETIIKVFFDELKKTVTKQYMVLGFNMEVREYTKRLLNNVKYNGWHFGFMNSSETFLELKKNIEESLKVVNAKIVVFVDDLDRLLSNELFALLQLVRNSGSLKRIIFVLSMDEERVKNKIKTFLNSEDEERYLEKIVQLPIRLPKTDNLTLERYLMKLINEKVLSGLDVTDDEKKAFLNCFSYFYYQTGKVFFKNLRDIKRFINDVRVTLPPIARNVNIYDYFLVSILSVFAGDIYKELQNNKMLYISFRNSIMGKYYSGDEVGKEKKELMRRHIEDITKNCSNKSNILEILALLFSNVHEIYPLEDYEMKCEQRDKRIELDDYYERYFTRGIADDDISDDVVEDIFNDFLKAGDYEFKKTLIVNYYKKLNESQRLKFVHKLEKLTVNCKNINTKQELAEIILLDLIVLESFRGFVYNLLIDISINLIQQNSNISKQIEFINDISNKLRLDISADFIHQNMYVTSEHYATKKLNGSDIIEQYLTRLRQELHGTNIIKNFPDSFNSILNSWLTNFYMDDSMRNKNEVNEYIESLIESSVCDFVSFISKLTHPKPIKGTFDIDDIFKKYHPRKLVEIAREHIAENRLDDEKQKDLVITFEKELSEALENRNRNWSREKEEFLQVLSDSDKDNYRAGLFGKIESFLNNNGVVSFFNILQSVNEENRLKLKYVVSYFLTNGTPWNYRERECVESIISYIIVVIPDSELNNVVEMLNEKIISFPVYASVIIGRNKKIDNLGIEHDLVRGKLNNDVQLRNSYGSVFVSKLWAYYMTGERSHDIFDDFIKYELYKPVFKESLWFLMRESTRRTPKENKKLSNYLYKVMSVPEKKRANKVFMFVSALDGKSESTWDFKTISNTFDLKTLFDYVSDTNVSSLTFQKQEYIGIFKMKMGELLNNDKNN